MDNLNATNNAADYLQDLNIIFGTIGPCIELLGGGLDGRVELHELEENNATQKVAIKTTTKPVPDAELDERVDENDWVL